MKNSTSCLITMFRELTNPVTMNLVALGHPLYRAERLAAVIVVWVVLLCTMSGYTLSIEGVPQQAREEDLRPLFTPLQGMVVAGICGILPVATGTAGVPSRTLLHW